MPMNLTRKIISAHLTKPSDMNPGDEIYVKFDQTLTHDMNALMRQAQKMQEDMKAKQAELEAAEYTGSAAGEMVTVKMNGKHEVLSITIKPEAVDPDDIEMLEDMVAAAINATVKQVDETAEAEMGKLTGGLNIPGL